MKIDISGSGGPPGQKVLQFQISNKKVSSLKYYVVWYNDQFGASVTSLLALKMQKSVSDVKYGSK